MTTGEIMKARRKELGISAETVAEKLNVSVATIYRYEKGDIEKVPSSILGPLSEILYTTPRYLMGWGDGEQRKLNSEEITLVDLYRNAEPAFQQEAIEMLRRHQRK